LPDVQIEIVAYTREARVERQFHHRVVWYRNAFGAARWIVHRRFGGDAQVGMQAQARYLDTAALQQRTAKRQRQADRISFDIVAERQKCRSVEREIEEAVVPLLEDRFGATVDAGKTNAGAFNFG